jgi:predicted fused transcriptional regulator/phosphomethylpyrimidine kinase/predicted XRE-type DNA-binding protein
MIDMAVEVFFIQGEKTIHLKKTIAKILYSNKIEQSKISEILNLSQPMVSNYCGSKEKISDNIMKMAQEIAEKIIDKQSINFQTCVTFSDKNVEGNFLVAEKNEILTDENSKIIDNLKQAFYKLKEKDISGLIPEVKINIAMSKNAKKSDDVASFLNGLIITEDKITGYNSIRFGKSKHLSSLLLNLKNKINANAIMNIAYIKNVEKTDMNYVYLAKDYSLKDRLNKVDILLHKGDFGIEPCAYIIGENAVDVVNKLIKIKDKLK